MSNPIASLKVSKAHLNEAFKLVKKLCRPSSAEEAILSFDGSCLHIELGGMAVTPKAEGSWPLQVRIPGSFIQGLAKFPPSGDPVVIAIEGKRLQFGSSSVACIYQEPWSRSIELPMNPTPLQVLGLRHKYTQEEIEASGYAQTLRENEAWAMKKAEKASDELKEFAITPQMIFQLVQEQSKALKGMGI